MEQYAHKPLFTPVQVGISGLIGGPVGAGYTIAINYRRRGNEMGFLLTVVAAVALIFVTFMLLYSLPEKYFLRFPKYVLLPFYAAPAYAIGTAIWKKYAEDNETGESWGKLLAISVLGFLFMYTGVRTFSDSNPPMQGERIGGNLGKNRYLFYDKVSKEDATVIYQKLDDMQYFTSKFGQPRLQLDSRTDSVVLSVPLDQKFWVRPGYLNYYKELQANLQSEFPEKNLYILFYSQTPAGRKEQGL